MKDQSKTKRVLIQELASLRQRIAELEQSESERKNVEEALRERDIQLRKLTSWVPGMIYQFTKRLDGTYCVPFTTEAIKDIFGCSPQDVREDFSPIARIILPDDFDKVVGSIEYSAKHLTIWTCEYRVQIPGQSIRWLLGNSTPEKLADGSIAWYGFNTDITERKQAEDEKQKRLTRTLVLDNTSQTLANVTLDYEGALQAIARYLSELIGDACTLNLLSEDGQFIHTVAVHHSDPDTSAHILKMMSSSPYDIKTGLMGSVARENKPLLITDTPQEQIRADMKPELHPYLDRPGLYSMLMVPMRAQGKVIGTIGLTRDNPGKSYRLEDQSLLQELADRSALTIISARLYSEKIQHHAHLKNLLDALRRSEENFRRSFDESPLGVRIVTEESETIYANRAILNVYGYDSIEELKTTPGEKRYTPESFAEHQIRREKRKRGGDDPSEYDISIVRKDGEVRHLHVFRKDILWDGESQFQVLYNDITDRKRMEDALRESEERFRLIFKNAPIGITHFDLEGTVTACNQHLAEILGALKEKIVGINMLTTFKDMRQKAALEEALSGRIGYYEGEYVSVTGTKSSTIRTIYAPLLAIDGSLAGGMSITEDITERKLAEDQIHASLLEKDILLGEVHHRVKNNMQVISGLLDLQARSSGNPELMEMLNESKSRIQAMALVQEKLYGSKDFARIDMAGYVRALSQDLFQSYKITPGKIDLIIQTDGDVYVDINKAIPCGLILNELISNALKHAFPIDRQGKLQIIIRETKNTEIEIVVRDNGLSLPDNVDIHNPRTVGLHLVNGLVKNQLDGQIEVRRDNGTEFRIKFPL